MTPRPRKTTSAASSRFGQESRSSPLATASVEPNRRAGAASRHHSVPSSTGMPDSQAPKLASSATAPAVSAPPTRAVSGTVAVTLRVRVEQKTAAASQKSVRQHTSGACAQAATGNCMLGKRASAITTTARPATAVRQAAARSFASQIRFLLRGSAKRMGVVPSWTSVENSPTPAKMPMTGGTARAANAATSLN